MARACRSVAIGTPAVVAVRLSKPLPEGLPPAMADVAVWEALRPAVAVPALTATAPRFEVA